MDYINHHKKIVIATLFVLLLILILFLVFLNSQSKKAEPSIPKSPASLSITPKVNISPIEKSGPTGKATAAIPFTGVKDGQEFTDAEIEKIESDRKFRNSLPINGAYFQLGYDYQENNMVVRLSDPKSETRPIFEKWIEVNHPDIPLSSIVMADELDAETQNKIFNERTNSVNSNNYNSAQNNAANSNSNPSSELQSERAMLAIIGEILNGSLNNETGNITSTPIATPIANSQQPTTTPSQSLPPSSNYTPTTPTGDYPNSYINLAKSCLINKSAYELASSYTGVPWQIIAGIHFVEGGCNAQKSCVSGRKLGANEPDLYGNCSSTSTVGKPVAIGPGQCGFTSLSDSCIYGANHLIGKIGKIPETIQELAKSLGRYNGTGNANCGRVNASMPYCPAPYEGYDHIYPFSKYDSIHQNMYLVYCADYTKCNPPKSYERIGVLTIANILSNL